MTALYTLRLKAAPVLDILAVAAGFLLRAAAGAAATGVRLSDWFLLVALFGSLFLVTPSARPSGPTSRWACLARGPRSPSTRDPGSSRS